MPTIHEFESTGEAYNDSQWRDDIADGDVLHVPSEGVTGILIGAWPVAVTSEHGAFHTLADGSSFSAIAQLCICIKCAPHLGEAADSNCRAGTKDYTKSVKAAERI